MNGKVYIVGAHSRGQTLKEYLTFLDHNICIEAFLTDDLSENKDTIDGIPVKKIDTTLHTEYSVYLATRGVYHEKLEKELHLLGFQEIIPVTVELDRALRNEYVKKQYERQGKSFLMIDDLSLDMRQQIEGKNHNLTACLYVAHSIYDQPMQTEYKDLTEEKTIQVGAALTEKRIAPDVLTDDQGENISSRNKQFCELTALYWIWKHGKDDYMGLVHYRRHFLLPEDWMMRMAAHNIDVVLPVPLYVRPSIADNYKERHIASDWEFLMDYLKKNHPDDYRKASLFFQSNLYSPCNMFIMNREVLNNMCSWLFPILDAVVQHGGQKEDVYMNRYPGFISERLITYYLETNRDKYKLAYADKNFLT